MHIFRDTDLVCMPIFLGAGSLFMPFSLEAGGGFMPTFLGAGSYFMPFVLDTGGGVIILDTGGDFLPSVFGTG